MFRKALDYYGDVLSEKDRAILMEYPLRRIMQLPMEESNQSECINDVEYEMSSSSDDEPPAKKVAKATKKVLDDDDKETMRLQRQAEREKCYAVARKHLQEGGFDGYFYNTVWHENLTVIKFYGLSKLLN